MRNGVYTFENEDGQRWAMGTHDPQRALDAFRDEDRANGIDADWQLCATDMKVFEYGWWLRVEPAAPDYEREYIAAEPGDVNAEPGVTIRP